MKKILFLLLFCITAFFSIGQTQPNYGAGDIYFSDSVAMQAYVPSNSGSKEAILRRSSTENRIFQYKGTSLKWVELIGATGAGGGTVFRTNSVTPTAANVFPLGIAWMTNDRLDMLRNGSMAYWSGSSWIKNSMDNGFNVPNSLRVTATQDTTSYTPNLNKGNRHYFAIDPGVANIQTPDSLNYQGDGEIFVYQLQNVGGDTAIVVFENTTYREIPPGTSVAAALDTFILASGEQMYLNFQVTTLGEILVLQVMSSPNREWVAQEIAAAGDGNGIYGGNGTIPSGTVATGDEFSINYPSTTLPAIEILDPSIYIRGGNGKASIGVEDTYAVISYQDVANIQIGETIFQIIDTRATPLGIEYNADYSANYTNRSLVDKEYVTAAIAGGGGGTVTSVDGSGGTTGLTLTGGPITTAGTLTIGGTLAIANGGTGSSSQTAWLLADSGQIPTGNKRTTGTFHQGSGSPISGSSFGSTDGTYNTFFSGTAAFDETNFVNSEALTLYSQQTNSTAKVNTYIVGFGNDTGNIGSTLNFGTRVHGSAGNVTFPLIIDGLQPLFNGATGAGGQGTAFGTTIGIEDGGGGSWGFDATTSGGGTFNLDFGGSIQAFMVQGGGGIWTPSDRRLKTQIRELSVLDNIEDMRGVRYTFKKSGKKSIGVIAQELQKFFPEAVTKASNGFLAVDYQAVAAIALQGAKENKEKIDLLETQLFELHKRLENLETQAGIIPCVKMGFLKRVFGKY